MSEGMKNCPLLASAFMAAVVLRGSIILEEEAEQVKKGVSCARGECAVWDSLNNRCALGRYQDGK
jgi:hypothetical protein